MSSTVAVMLVLCTWEIWKPDWIEHASWRVLIGGVIVQIVAVYYDAKMLQEREVKQDATDDK